MPASPVARGRRGVEIGCAGVAVFRVDLDHEIACEVNVLGISSPPYPELFPHHVEAYERRFRPTDA